MLDIRGVIFCHICSNDKRKISSGNR